MYHAPTCPGCSATDKWAATATGVDELSKVRAAIKLQENGEEGFTMRDVVALLLRAKCYPVVIVHCGACGHILATQIVDG